MIRNTIILLIIGFLFYTCTPPQKSTRRPPRGISVYEKTSLAHSTFKSALEYEDQYYYYGRNKDALIAISKFEKYFLLSPQGVYACESLLKKAKLLYMIREFQKAKIEINRVKNINSLRVDCKEEINHIENLFK